MAANHTKPAGRPKGTPNKLSGSARDNIAAVFTRLGGTSAMADWANENKTEFYKLYSKLLPLHVTGADGGAVEFNITITPHGT